MLTSLQDSSRAECAVRLPIPIAEATFPSPFASTLEYNPPARGPWNIVHTGMLLPESHQIFACARGCLRGVILTAAEMMAMERMSWIAVTEKEMYDGEMEQSVVDGTAAIIRRLPTKPRAILLFLSCIHLFSGCDYTHILSQLRILFPDIDFTDCYMTPTMRFSGINPDITTRRQLYSLLRPRPLNPRAVNIIGNDRPTIDDCEVMQLLQNAGYTVRDITTCTTYDEYQAMAEASLNITTFLPAVDAAETLAKRLGQKHLHLPLAYSDDEIVRHLRELAAALNLPMPELSQYRTKAAGALANARAIIQDTPIAIDATATPRPLGLARRLLQAGFNVTRVQADLFSPEEEADFRALQSEAPTLRLTPLVNPAMEFAPPAEPDLRLLAIGQKAAWYGNAPHFVNIVAGGGLHGFVGLAKLSTLLVDAFRHTRDVPAVISHKGIGCPSCL